VNWTKTIARLKLTPILAIAIFSQGCVGIVVHDMQTRTFEPTNLEKAPNVHSVSHISTINEKHLTENPTTSWLEENWGHPSHVKLVTTPAQGEFWTYNFDHKWCGVMPWLFIPIPLFLPVGREHVVFYIQNGRVVKAERTTLSEYQTMVGFGPEGPMAYSHRVY